MTRVATPPSWRPSPALELLVSGVVSYDFTPGPEGHRGLPSTSLTVVLSLEEPLRLGWWDEPGAVASHVASVSGLHDRPAVVGGSTVIGRPTRQRGVWLTLTPAGCRSLLRVPAAALANQIVDLPTVAPHLAELPERVAEAGTDVARRRVVEDVLLHALAKGGGGTVRPDVACALPALIDCATVQGVAAQLGWSRRHLSTAFRSELGVTPKQYQRIARFDSSRRHLARVTESTRPPLAQVAASSGYADQAHLTREWVTLAGCSPTAWLRAEHS